MLVPTRELAVQVHQMTERLAQFTDIRAALVVGGLSLNTQVRERERERERRK
jgi:ATP-dependent RNA helicase DDX27